MVSRKSRRKPAALRSYLAAFVLTLAAVGLRRLLVPWVGTDLPFVGLFGAVALSVLIGGVGPGTFAALLGYVLADFLVVQPQGRLLMAFHGDTKSIVVSAIYLLSCAAILWLGESLRRSQRAHEQHERDLKAGSEAQRLLLALHDATRDQTDPEKVIWEIVTRVGRHLRASRCLYGQISETQDRVLITCDYTDGALSLAGSYDLNTYGAAMIADLKAGRTVVIDDVDSDPRTSDEGARVAYAAAQSLAMVSVPLIKSGRYVAVLAVHQSEPRVWTEDEIRLLEQVAERCWFAVETARANAALRESRSMLALAMRSGGMGTWSYDPASRWFTVSPEFDELCGLPPGTGGHSYERVKALIHPDDVLATETAFERAVAAGADFRIELRVRCGPGQWRWLESIGRIAVSQGAKPLMVHGVCLDITERRRVMETQREAARRKDEFLASLAHELRNPLAPIRNAAEILRAKLPADSELRAAQVVIDRQVKHLTRLVDDLLDSARYMLGKIRLRKVVMPLDAALRDAVDSVRPLFVRNGQQLDIDLPEERLCISGDPTRVVQVVLNLLSNAAKYSPSGSRIALRLCREGHHAVISVRDQGAGIAPEQMQHLFEMFSQGTAPGQVSEGLGIGLALVRAFAEMHGGSVEAKSEGVGKGSEFIVRFPISNAAASATAAEPATLARTARMRVLVVDDNLDAAETLENLLKLVGYEVEVAFDGPSAVEAAARRHPDAILLDLGLPGMDGIEVARRIRNEPWGADVRLIALTGWGQQSDRQRSTQAGFDHHLTKPADLASVEAALARDVPRKSAA